MLTLVLSLAGVGASAQSALSRYMSALPVSPSADAQAMPAGAAPLRASVPQPLAAPASQQSPTLYGCMIYSSLWDTNTDGAFGIYSFPASAGTAFTPVAVAKDYNLVGGACFDGMFCGYRIQTFGGSLLSSTFYLFDADTWTLVNKISLARAFANYATSAIAYNPANATLYGQFMTSDGQGLCISSIDVTTGEPTQVSVVQDGLMFLTFSFDKKGTLYAIADDGNLYTVDVATGKATLVGSTGVANLQYGQSATIDAATGRMFWSSMDSSRRSALYEVSTTTGKATLVSDYGATIEFVGLHTASPFCEPSAPAAAAGLAVSYATPGDNEATVSLTAPTAAIDGTPLSGDLNVTIAIDYVPTFFKSAAVKPGEKFSVTENIPSGKHKVDVWVGNQAGDGLRAWTTTYTGVDLPGAVGNLAFTIEGSKAKVSWTAPTTGLNGGYFPTDGLYYKVYRYPGNVLVADEYTATSFEEDLPEGMAKYYYRVVACTTEDGGEATTDAIQCGDVMTIPYEVEFTDASSLDLYTCIDANGDNKNWKWAENAAVSEDRYGNDSADNWLITPDLLLTTDWIYRLTFTTKAYGSYYVETLKTALGSGNTVADMTVPLGTYTVNGEKYVEHSELLEVKADGHYNVGFHHASSGYGTFQSLYIGSVKVEKYIPTTAPDSVTDLRVTSGEAGALTAAVSFKTPARCINGSALTAVKQIVVYVNDTEVKRFSNPTPGEELGFSIKLANGNNAVKVVAYDDQTHGREYVKTVWGGVDVPGYVRNLKAVWNANDDMSADLSWDAPTEGLNKGYINPDALTYNYMTYSSFIGYYDSKTGITDRHYTASTSLLTGQTYYYGAIRAVSAAGSSSVYVPFGITLGTPLTSFAESFANGATTTSYWSVGHLSDIVTWGMANDGTIGSYDADNGYAFSSGADGAGESRLETPILSIDATTPQSVEFYLYRKPGNTSTVTVEATTDGREFKPVAAAITTDGATGWCRCEVPLASLRGARRVQLGFHSNVADGEFVAIDKVALIGTTTAISAPAASNGAVSVSGRSVTVSGLAGQTLQVVSPDGRVMMKRVVATDSDTFVLPRGGVCFVICGGHTVKAVVR